MRRSLSTKPFRVPGDLAVDLHRLVDHEALWQVLWVHLEQSDPYIRLAAVAVELQLQRIDTAAIDHHQIGRSAVADVAAAAFRFHKHVMPGRLPQRVDRFMRHENRKGIFSLNVKTACGIF